MVVIETIYVDQSSYIIFYYQIEVTIIYDEMEELFDG